MGGSDSEGEATEEGATLDILKTVEESLAWRLHVLPVLEVDEAEESRTREGWFSNGARAT
jgi:hypothetical protein